MTNRHSVRGCAFLVLFVLVMAGCASGPPKPSDVKLTLSTAADANPDASGRPSPVVVRIYQLKSDAAFAGAEFFSLYNDEKQALGPDLIQRDEFTLRPGESSQVPLKVAGDARFVGFIAAYRDYRKAQWRVVTKAPLKGKPALSVGRLTLEFAAK